MSMRDAATDVIRKLRGAGFEAYLVGGCVRDLLLGIAPHDYDIATSARAEDFHKIFSTVIDVGAAFGVSRVKMDDDWIEVATFRQDLEYTDGRRPEGVVFTDAKGDVHRRDFTINGLLMDPLDNNRVIDYVGGQDDISAKIVRCIGSPEKRFSEDKLRLLRAVRFAARLDYEIEPDTFDALVYHAREINQVSAERIGTEIITILTGAHADRALDLLRETGLLRHVLPEAEAMVGVQQPEQFHPEGDVYTHTKLMLGMLDAPSIELALATLLHDIGKPPTYTESTDRIRFNEHAKVGAEMAEKICRRLRLPTEVCERVVALVNTHMRFIEVKNMKESTLVRFLREPYFPDALELHRLDCEASHRKLDNYRFCKERLESLAPEKVRPPRLLTGHDLIEMGYAPGPRFSEILTALEDAQLEGAIKTHDEAVEFVNRRFTIPERKSEEAIG